MNNQPWPPTAAPMPVPPPSNTMLYVAVGCAGLMFMALCAVGLGAVVWGISRNSGGLAGMGNPGVRIHAQVTTYTGSAGIPAGATCELPVEQVVRDDGSVWCHVQMTCAGIPLYGSAENGFFPCTITPSAGGVPGRVVGQDLETTLSDRDGAFMVNTDARMFEAHDDTVGPNGFFMVVGTITSIE